DRAFRGALELRSPRGADDLEGQLLFQIKQGVEWHVVGSLADRDYPRALAFARSADVPKREVYDQLLAAASRGALKNKKDVSFDVIGLIRECQSADGSYPYQGMQKILLNPGIDPEMKRQAMGLAFAAAARETRGYELA